MKGKFAAGGRCNASSHFRAYKEGTSHMIKSLSLVPMSPLDVEGMELIFKKDTTKRKGTMK